MTSHDHFNYSSLAISCFISINFFIANHFIFDWGHNFLVIGSDNVDINTLDSIFIIIIVFIIVNVTKIGN